MNNINDKILELLEKEISFSLVTIAKKNSSSPRTAGTKMIVLENGETIGTIGGGVVEAKTTKMAVDIFKTKKPVLEHFNLSGEDVEKMDMICGGILDILIEFIDAHDKNNLNIFKELIECRDNRKNSVLITRLPNSADDNSSKRHGFLKNDGTLVGELELPKEVLEKIDVNKRMRESYLSTYEEVNYLLEPIISFGALYIFGAGHISQKLATLTKMVDFRTIVLDDREEFANIHRFPLADKVVVLDNFKEAMNNLDIDKESFIVIVTRGHSYDKTVLAESLKTNAGYIGMIGSKIKRNAIYHNLKKEGFTDNDLARVHSPIGLSILAQTPEEIAVSILAELIKCRAEM